MSANEEHAKVLLEQTNYDKREALLLLRKRTVSRCAAVEGNISEIVDRALEVAIEIDHQYLQHLQREMIEESRRSFQERFAEFYPNKETTNA